MIAEPELKALVEDRVSTVGVAEVRNLTRGLKARYSQLQKSDGVKERPGVALLEIGAGSRHKPTPGPETTGNEIKGADEVGADGVRCGQGDGAGLVTVAVDMGRREGK